MTRRWLNSADVEIDEATGALLVKIGDAELKVDMAEVDVAAIVDGIAGSGAGGKDPGQRRGSAGQCGAHSRQPRHRKRQSGHHRRRTGRPLPCQRRRLADRDVPTRSQRTC